MFELHLDQGGTVMKASDRTTRTVGQGWAGMSRRVLLLLALTLLAIPAHSHAQPTVRRPGCQHRCWARAFISGTGTQTLDQSARGDQAGNRDTNTMKNLDMFELASATAFVVSDPLYLNADFPGTMHFHARHIETRVGCTPQTFTQSIVGAPSDGSLAIINYGGAKGTKVYLDPGWFDDSYSAVQDLLSSGKFRWTESSYTCGDREVPGREQSESDLNPGFSLWWNNLCTLPGDETDLTLAQLIAQRGATLSFESKCQNIQHNAISDAKFTWDVTAKITIELCPDQSLNHNCRLAGRPNLPPRH
jgi:hypothetical protein